MNPILDKFEQDFASLKAGKKSSYDFFNSLWEPLSIIKGGAKDFLGRVQVWSETEGASDPANLGLATFSRALVAMHEDWIEDGLRLSSEAHRIFEGIHDEDGVSLSGLLIGAFYRTLGNIDIALRYIVSSWDYMKKNGKYPFFCCACSYQLSELYMETKAYDRAIQTYDDCIRLADRYGYLSFQGLALSGKAQAYHALGQSDLARESFLKALPILTDTSFRNPYTRLASDYGTFLMDEGDLDQAIEYHTLAMKLRSENRMQLGSITNMIQLGKIFLLQGKKAEALAMWQQGLDRAISLNAKPKIGQLHLLLSEFYESNNEIEKSLAHYRSFHQVNEEVNREDGEKKVKRAEILFAAEQTEKENAIIKAQKAEIEKKNIELQETIDELTITKVSRRAKALTLLIAIVMIIAEEPIMHLILHYIGEENFYFVMGAKILVILSLKPIDSAIEHYLLRRVILKKKGH